jgi:hypothetical protein
MIVVAVGLALAGTACASTAAAGSPTGPRAQSRTDSAGIEWLCRPGVSPDPCQADETATVEPESGTDRVEHTAPAANPPVDCFYVYPTVSAEPGALEWVRALPTTPGSRR